MGLVSPSTGCRLRGTWNRVSLNLMTPPRDDLEAVRQLQRGCFRELRALVASPEPEAAQCTVHQRHTSPHLVHAKSAAASSPGAGLADQETRLWPLVRPVPRLPRRAESWASM